MSNEDWTSTEGYWENRYLDGQTGWDRGEVHPALIHWLANESLKKCRILIPGCGNGYEVVHLAALGFEVIAVDFAESPVKSVKAKLDAAGLSARIIQADIHELRLSDPVDVVYEQTCLCALEPASRTKYEAKIHDLLVTGGTLFALFMQTVNPEIGPPFHCDVDDMKRLFPGNRWNWIDSPERQYDHPSGTIHEIACSMEKL